MADTDDRVGSEGGAVPLVGRGSALRDSAVEAFGSLDGEDQPPRSARPVPRPPLGRSARARSARGRPWVRIDTQSPRTRLALGVALVVVLAAAWVWVGRDGSGARPLNPLPSTVHRNEPRHTVPQPADRVVPVPGWVPPAIAATCAARQRGTSSTRVIVVECTPGRGVVALEYRELSSVATLRAEYAAESPRRGGGAGAPQCARGRAEERSWSVPGSPAVARGRYTCSLVGDRARMVWSTEHVGRPATAVLAIASREDGDLRSLYEWWVTVPGPSSP